MATNKMRAIHPGEILREEYLAPLGMSAHALSMAYLLHGFTILFVNEGRLLLTQR